MADDARSLCAIATGDDEAALLQRAIAEATCGNVENLVFLSSMWQCKHPNANLCRPDVIEPAARNGHDAVVHYLLIRSTGCIERDGRNSNDLGAMGTICVALRAASQSGALNVIVRLHDGNDGNFSRVDPDADIVFHAAYHGHVHILEWMFARFPGAILSSSTVVDRAFDGNHQSVIDWLEAKCAEIPDDANLAPKIVARYLALGDDVAAERVRSRRNRNAPRLDQ